jgi:uncharacterized membrane protein HdeD (DUF308 family)
MAFTSIYATSDPMSALLAQNWWAVALRGAVAILFGICALAFTGPTLLSIVLLFAVYCLADAVFEIVAAVRAARHGEHWGMLVLAALCNLLAGVVALLTPGIAIVAFVLLLAVWAIVTGVLALVAAFRLRLDHGRGWMILGGAASLIFGVLLIVAPLLGAVVLTWWIGAYAIVLGVSLVVLAFRLRPHRDDHHHLGGAALHGV